MLELLRGNRLVLALALTCTLVLGLATAGSVQIGSIQDDAWYLDTATALARGQGFVRPWTPDLMPETSLPPGLPFLLTPLRWLFPASFLPAQLLSLAATLGIVLQGARYFRRTIPSIAGPATLFLAVNAGIIGYSMQVMSEAIYTLLVLLIVALYHLEDERARPRPGVFLLIGLAAAGAYFVRSWGLALVGALVVACLLRRRWLGALAVGLPCAAGYVAWSWRNQAAGGVGATYGIAPDTVVPFIQRFNENLPAKLVTHWLRDLPQWFITPRTSFTLGAHGLDWLALLVGAFVLAVIVIGYVAQVRRGVSLPEVFVVAHAAIVSVAPLNARYWIPIVPFLIHYFVQGTAVVLRSRQAGMPDLRDGGDGSRSGSGNGGRSGILARRPGSSQAGMPDLRGADDAGRPDLRGRQLGLTVLILVGLTGLHIVRDVQDVLDPPRLRVPDVAIGPQWIAANTPPDAVVLANTPRVSYLYAQRTIWAFPDGKGEVFDAYPGLAATDRRARLLDVIQLKQVEYILIEPALGQQPPFKWSDYVRQFVVPALEADPARFHQVFAGAGGMTRVYQVVR